jgi:SAM-dependent methyltransferase
MLSDFGHPDIPALVYTIFDNPPDYDYLAEAAAQAPIDAHRFKRFETMLNEAALSPKTTRILDLACGPLATQALLFNSLGYQAAGADEQIPPAYLPLSGIRQWFKRRKHIKAWQAATLPYYQQLAQETGMKLKWNNLKLEMADLTRLPFPDAGFEVVICANYLQHAPNVDSLLLEVVRVLKPGGLFLAEIRPYTALNGDFGLAGAAEPWGHLRPGRVLKLDGSLIFNQWREAQFRASLETHFNLDQWLAEQDDEAQARLTPEIKAKLTDNADYSDEELTRKQVLVLGRKKA